MTTGGDMAWLAPLRERWPTWTSDDGRATMVCGDCLEVLPLLPEIDAVVTDPPYGIGAYKSGTMGGGVLARQSSYRPTDWDDCPPTRANLNAIIGLSRACVIWGGNYYDANPSSGCWLVWDKITGENTFADCELAWTNLPGTVRKYSMRWQGMLRGGEEQGEQRVHPTQKPVALMSWCMDRAKVAPGMLVLDPYTGSGTTGVACLRTGRRFLGIEIDPTYYGVACERIAREAAQPQLFDDTPPAPQPRDVPLFGDGTTNTQPEVTT